MCACVRTKNFSNATICQLRVSQDLSIMRVDDIYPAAMTTLPLTTMAKPKYESGLHPLACSAPETRCTAQLNTCRGLCLPFVKGVQLDELARRVVQVG